MTHYLNRYMIYHHLTVDAHRSLEESTQPPEKELSGDFSKQWETGLDLSGREATECPQQLRGGEGSLYPLGPIACWPCKGLTPWTCQTACGSIWRETGCLCWVKPMKLAAPAGARVAKRPGYRDPPSRDSASGMPQLIPAKTLYSPRITINISLDTCAVYRARVGTK